MSILTVLRRHPFPVIAYFERVVAVSFAFPVDVLRALVPDPLEIDTYKEFGFLTVALVWTKKLRPAGFPAFLGQDFFLVGYRVFTRLRDESGRRLRGLKIVQSETDKRRMVWLGNLMTHYHYRYVHVSIKEVEAETCIETSSTNGNSTLNLRFESLNGPASLPEGSPFEDWRAARLFAGPMPFTFSPENDGSLVIIEGSRQDWLPQPIHILDWQVGLFHDPPLSSSKPILANAFIVKDVCYRWKRGRILRTGAAL